MLYNVAETDILAAIDIINSSMYYLFGQIKNITLIEIHYLSKFTLFEIIFKFI